MAIEAVIDAYMGVGSPKRFAVDAVPRSVPVQSKCENHIQMFSVDPNGYIASDDQFLLKGACSASRT